MNGRCDVDQRKRISTKTASEELGLSVPCLCYDGCFFLQVLGFFVDDYPSMDPSGLWRVKMR